MLGAQLPNDQFAHWHELWDAGRSKNFGVWRVVSSLLQISNVEKVTLVADEGPLHFPKSLAESWRVSSSASLSQQDPCPTSWMIFHIIEGEQNRH